MNNIDKDIKSLESSTLFHMSLGSKELFHSNFLHWLAENYWDFFISVMHKLAGVEKFWWENENGPNDKQYSLANNNLKVLRENRNFDLSIYILDSESESVTDVDNDEDNELQDNKGKKKQIWIPVLVLENKMKSLPYREQLQTYTHKAIEEWRMGKKIGNIKEKKDRACKDSEYCWEPEHEITFILLSLIESGLSEAELKMQHNIPFSRNKNSYNLSISCKWNANTYCDLLCAFRKIRVNFNSNLDALVFEDYCKFVNALINIADNDWKIECKLDFFRKKICPWTIENYQPDKQVTLRIDDIRQKIHYSQLQRILRNKIEERLKDKNINADFIIVKSPTDVKEIKESRPIICCSTNFLHNVGLIEVYVTFKSLFGVNLVGVEIQGDAYEHVFFDIQKGGPETYLKLDSLTKELDFFFEFNNPESVKTKKFPCFGKDEIILLNKESNRFDEAKNFGNKRFGYYKKDGVIYQKVQIPKDVTIDDVLNATVEDIISVIKEIGKK